jgi:hypothetical protein
MSASAIRSLSVLVCSAALTIAACGKKEEPPKEEAMVSTALEGELDIVAWPGYIERGETDKAYDWVTAFEADGHAADLGRYSAEPAGRRVLAAGRQCAV